MIVYNRHFRHDYKLIDELEVGIVLTGGEVKSVLAGACKLEGAFAKIVEQEMLLFNLEIARYRYDHSENYNPTRPRRLLLHRKEIVRLQSKLKSGSNLTLVPTSCYFAGRHIKLKLALARGEVATAKRKLEKERDVERQQAREIKQKFTG